MEPVPVPEVEIAMPPAPPLPGSMIPPPAPVPLDSPLLAFPEEKAPQPVSAVTSSAAVESLKDRKESLRIVKAHTRRGKALSA